MNVTQRPVSRGTILGRVMSMECGVKTRELLTKIRGGHLVPALVPACTGIWCDTVLRSARGHSRYNLHGYWCFAILFRRCARPFERTKKRTQNRRGQPRGGSPPSRHQLDEQLLAQLIVTPICLVGTMVEILGIFFGVAGNDVHPIRYFVSSWDHVAVCVHGQLKAAEAHTDRPSRVMRHTSVFVTAFIPEKTAT